MIATRIVIDGRYYGVDRARAGAKIAGCTLDPAPRHDLDEVHAAEREHLGLDPSQPALAPRYGPAGVGETEAMSQSDIPDYGRVFSGPGGSFAFLEDAIAAFLPVQPASLRILDVGCGNGYWALRLADTGHRLVGIDASTKRIENARREAPGARFERLDIGNDLVSQLGEEPFDVVISTEVVEHLYLPNVWADACLSALKPGGRFICSTPYHGYLKNLAIALTGSWDRHHHTLRSLGHIKFFSQATLRELLDRSGFENIRIRGAGRLPYLWKSMVMAADRPA